MNIKSKIVKKYTVKRYQENDCQDWNAFIGQAKNATFLFHRDFMEYHKDRFEDFSLIVLDGEKWVAVLPANLVGNVLYSHQGLSYGGLVYGDKIKLASVIAITHDVLVFLNGNAISSLQLKTIPSIYHQKPAEELSYVLFLANAKLIRRDSLSVIDLSKSFTLSKGRKEGLKRGEKNKLIIKEDMNFELYWDVILQPNLSRKFAASPVHTKEEIIKLNKLFPDNIKLFNVYNENKIVAGTVVFVSENVVHCQYISANEQKNELGSLDFLHNYLLKDKFNYKRFFDFGVSNENQGKKLNNGLSYWKESFGASTMVHDFYEVETANFGLLEDVIL